MSVAPSTSCRPTTSPARVAANRLNAQKSSGPRTPEGKARSRANAVKHGLTGAGIALPTEDAVAVEGRFAALQTELGPSTVLGAILVKQVALLSVRLDRAALQEAAALSTRVRHAVRDLDADQRAEVADLIAGLATDPAANHRRLLATPLGVDALHAGLVELRRQAQARDPSVWTPAVAPRLEAHLGHSPTDSPRPRTVGLFEATLGNFQYLNPIELNPLPNRAAWLRWAQGELLAAIDAEIARLAALRVTMPDATDPLDRSEAQARALFDPGAEAILARKYEAEARRGLFRALREFRQAEAAASMTEVADAPPLDHAGSNEPTPSEPEPAPAQNEPNVPPLEPEPIALATAPDLGFAEPTLDALGGAGQAPARRGSFRPRSMV